MHPRARMEGEVAGGVESVGDDRGRHRRAEFRNDALRLLLRTGRESRRDIGGARLRLHRRVDAGAVSESDAPVPARHRARRPVGELGGIAKKPGHRLVFVLRCGIRRSPPVVDTQVRHLPRVHVVDLLGEHVIQGEGHVVGARVIVLVTTARAHALERHLEILVEDNVCSGE